MDAGAKAWLAKYAKRNYWRVAAWVEFEDLLQDGQEAYYEVLKRYPTAVDRAHIMRLFQLVFRSKIEDLVRANKKQIDDAASDIVENHDQHATLSTIIPDFSNFHNLLLKAPKQIKEALALLANDLTRKQLAAPYTSVNGKRETMNDRFCNMLGYNPKEIDIVGMIKDHFAPA